MSCKLYLENYENYYKPGDEIIGRVECNFDDSTRLRNIKIRLRCKERNQWKMKRGKTQVTYRGDNTIFAREQILYGSESSGEHHLRGSHTYRFKFVLSTNLPSSFEGPYGSIQYKLKVVIDRPWRFDNEDYCNFVVKAPLYLDRFPSEAFTQTTYEDEKTVCCCCCRGGNISMGVIMPRMAFVIGGNIDMMVKLTNLSNVNVKQLKIKLDTICTFKVTSPANRSKTTTERILKVKKHGVGAHGEYTYNLSIPIPDHTEVPNFTMCQLFEVNYRLQIEACLDGCFANLKIDTYPSLAHLSNQHPASAPPIGFSTAPRLDYPTAPPTTVPLATIDDDLNPPPYESLLPEQQAYSRGTPTAPFSPASAPPLTPSTSNGVTEPKF